MRSIADLERAIAVAEVTGTGMEFTSGDVGWLKQVVANARLGAKVRAEASGINIPAEARCIDRGWTAGSDVADLLRTIASALEAEQKEAGDG